MHVVTKMLVVFAAVLAVLLAALTMAYSANADRIVSGYRSAIDLEKATAASATADALRAREEAAEQARENEALNNQVNARQAEISALQTERSQLRTELEQAKAQVEAIGNRIDQLGATVDTQAALIRSYRDEATALREEQLAANRREIELVDRLNDLESQREVLEQTARALREQLAEAQLAVQTAARGGTGQPADGEPVLMSGPPVRATVQEVLRSPSGDDLAVINVGSNSGLRENVRMTISRGNQFLASLILVSVEPRQAVGRIDTLNRDVEVRPGDTVLSQLR